MTRFGPVLFPFTGAGVGGSHISTFLLAGALTRDHGIETRIVAPAGSSIAAEARTRGLAVVETADAPATRRETAKDVLRLPRRRRALAGFGPGAVVHACDLWSLQSWGPAAKSLGLPIVYHHRAFIAGRRAERWLLALADRIVCISEACDANLGDLARGRRRSIVNPFEHVHGREAFADARDEHVARWPEPGVRLIGFSGNFQARKRADYFVRAAAALARRDPAARFLVFGRDRDHKAADLAALAADLGLGERIHFAGFRSPPERNLAPLDVLAAPALAEPFGRTLLEAALLGVPYVATDDAGHGEIARRWGGGRLAAIEASPEAFAEVLSDTLNAPSPVALDAEARGRLAEDLRPDRHAAEVIKVYETLPERKA